MNTYKHKRWEISTVGPDPELQLVGSDASNGTGSLGLPVPSAVPANAQGRYTFLLAIARFGIGERATLVGMRQYLELGACIATGGAGSPNFPVKCQVKTPRWRFVDGNVTWMLKRIRPQNPGYYNTLNADGLQWRNALGPAQLFESLAPTLPPFNGQIPGDALEPSLAQFYDIRFPWNNDNAASILDCPITGPCTIALFASVLQTNPATRLAMPGTPPFSTSSGISKEDAFVGNYNTCARYSCIAGSLIFEQHEGGPAIKPGAEKCPPRPEAPLSAIEEHYDGRA